LQEKFSTGVRTGQPAGLKTVPLSSEIFAGKIFYRCSYRATGRTKNSSTFLIPWRLFFEAEAFFFVIPESVIIDRSHNNINLLNKI